MEYFINANKKEYDDADGSVNKPYKSLNDLLNNIDCKKDCEIFLSSGTYEVDETILSKGENCTITIKGKDDKTTLIQTSGWFSNSCGGNSSFTLNIFNLIYNIKTDLTQSNLNYIYCNLNFYNVVFDSIPNNAHSVFLPDNSIINFYNCTKTQESTKFLRCTDGKINLYNCYGCFTSGYGTEQSQWDAKNNLIVKQTNLNDKFNIIDNNLNSTYGVYSGLYKWAKKQFMLEQNNQLYTIKSEFYEPSKSQYKPITGVEVNNITDENLKKYGFDDIGDILKTIDKGNLNMLFTNDLEDGKQFGVNLKNGIKKIDGIRLLK
ncbi:hypothetical protein [Clostridium botulinum]|uniref:hypothetical protein n=1 Tax=Clostridium botulinum TaxID=1491 RepID=UPI001E519EBE|nr:hypothetical protein [Clostridium botulinum]MCD3252496.1 hypothetical protein [Clostridium botulinum C/D]MCD3277840.1 hypothetical protein [Clostridium botulinum C/D]MCD3281277.1 hypothetical protein [Clostridium botulinum C/D]MCD3355766.1 hypothetical protein [Clostridium botulinum C/D]